MGVEMNDEISRIRGGRAIALVGEGSKLALRGGAKGHSAALAEFTGADDQLWHLDPLDGDAEGFFRIRNRASGLVLDVSEASKDNGGTILLWTPHGGRNQQWKIQWMAEGWFRIRARHSGLVLDVKGNGKTPGSVVNQWSFHGGENQRWSAGHSVAFGGAVALRSTHGTQLTAGTDGTLLHKDLPIQAWELFTLVRADGTTGGHVRYGDTVALRTHHGTYLSASPGGTLNATVTHIKSWEQFTITRRDGSTTVGPVTTGDDVALRSSHGKYVMAHENGTMNAAADTPNSWERWRLDVHPDEAAIEFDYVYRPSNDEDLFLEIPGLQCIRPATGINGDIADFFTGLGVEFIAHGLSTFTVEGAIVGTVLGGAVIGSVELTKWIDEDRDPDDLYLRHNGSKIWPSGTYSSISAGEVQDVKRKVGFRGTCTVQLMDYDSGSGDDLLGAIHVDAEKLELIDGAAVVANYTGNPEEDALYAVLVIVGQGSP
jgi:hypothetical protein